MSKVVYAVEMSGDGPVHLFKNEQDAIDVCKLENESFDYALDPEDRGREYYIVAGYTLLDSDEANLIKAKLKLEIKANSEWDSKLGNLHD